MHPPPSAGAVAATVVPPIDKGRIARSFGRAAGSYDSVADLQRHAIQRLIEQLPADLTPQRIVDGGSGTGLGALALRERYPQAQLTLLDLAPAMVRHARARPPLQAAQHLCADLEAVPLASGSVELLFSSLALQWLPRLDLFLDEAWRLLAPGGWLLFSTLGPATLQELRGAWASVDANVHVNRFLPVDQIETALGRHPWRQRRLIPAPLVRHYPSLRALTHELKALGAHNLNPDQPTALTGRQRITRVSAHYETLRTATGLPASWQLLLGVLQR